MRVISMVPSWTETLIEAGVEVVGRTRFCIHPREKVAKIPIVGGTKDISWEKVKALNADLLLLDQEENPKSFAEGSPMPWVSTHVIDIESMIHEMDKLGEILSGPLMKTWAEKARNWKSLSKPPQPFPGVIETWGSWTSEEKIVYVIWKNPWMAAGTQTYIGSVVKALGFQMMTLSDEKYPEIPETLLQENLGFFSSEPFPFLKKKKDIQNLFLRGAIVDGEDFSWFGVRSFRFLDNYLR